MWRPVCLPRNSSPQSNQSRPLAIDRLENPSAAHRPECPPRSLKILLTPPVPNCVKLHESEKRESVINPRLVHKPKPSKHDQCIA
ncbi:hypothetical protein KC19_2G138100 [Ceratodon purpureus]|uniref:Uncharacterized protein n=1 Tax=Ceratodon purpureus TaxID=3225 RepID=A0A8T0IXG2_CERPU|nr:hypothetical protein KC19_2G138100 [Ceratodon purpureus]